MGGAAVDRSAILVRYRAHAATTATRLPIPFTGIYAISKFAIMGITSSFRFELAPFGIQVTSIEPGAMDTPMTADHQANLEKPGN